MEFVISIVVAVITSIVAAFTMEYAINFLLLIEESSADELFDSFEIKRTRRFQEKIMSVLSYPFI